MFRQIIKIYVLDYCVSPRPTEIQLLCTGIVCGKIIMHQQQRLSPKNIILYVLTYACFWCVMYCQIMLNKIFAMKLGKTLNTRDVGFHIFVTDFWIISRTFCNYILL